MMKKSGLLLLSILAAPLAAPLTLELAGEYLAADNVDLIQLGHQITVDQVIHAFRAGLGCHAKCSHLFRSC